MVDAEVRTANVIVVDRVIDAASNSFRVRLELPNPDNALPPGLRCKVEFEGMSARGQACREGRAPAVAATFEGRGEQTVPEEPEHKPVTKASVAAAPSK